KQWLLLSIILPKMIPSVGSTTVVYLHENCCKYGSSLWLFPARCGTKPMTWRNAYGILARAVESAGMAAKGISTHSTRRSLVNKLRRNGTDKAIIRKITGHRCDKGLDPYFEVEMDEVRGAIATL
ncbi:tyrosine-type recombinase/integrase, partial [Nostoc sp.]|uniref:tyrosine-type recombinase/integrase n=1 Tax=Nostoc sp. TaxID=1180 RepID=UPI002FF8CB66